VGNPSDDNKRDDRKNQKNAKQSRRENVKNTQNTKENQIKNTESTNRNIKQSQRNQEKQQNPHRQNQSNKSDNNNKKNQQSQHGKNKEQQRVVNNRSPDAKTQKQQTKNTTQENREKGTAQNSYNQKQTQENSRKNQNQNSSNKTQVRNNNKQQSQRNQSQQQQKSNNQNQNKNRNQTIEKNNKNQQQNREKQTQQNSRNQNQSNKTNNKDRQSQRDRGKQQNRSNKTQNDKKNQQQNTKPIQPQQNQDNKTQENKKTYSQQQSRQSNKQQNHEAQPDNRINTRSNAFEETRIAHKDKEQNQQSKKTQATYGTNVREEEEEEELAWKHYKEEAFAYASSSVWEGDAPVLEAVITEQLMWPYKIVAKIVLTTPLTKPDLGMNVCISCGSSSAPFRIFVGTLFQFEYIGSASSTAIQRPEIEQLIYEIELLHPLQKLAYETKYKIFQNKTHQEIIENVFDNADIDYISNLFDSEEADETNTQYNEVTLNFIIRLLQEKGYLGYFNLDATYIAADPEVGVEPILITPDYILNSTVDIDPTNMIEPQLQQEKIAQNKFFELIDFKTKTTAVVEKYCLFDHNPQSPDKPLFGSSSTWTSLVLPTKTSIYPANIKSNFDATTAAEKASDRASTRSIKFKAETTDYRFAPGKLFNISTSTDATNGSYFIESVVHKIEKKKHGYIYTNFAEGVFYDLIYLPEITLTKPKVVGVQTAVVVAVGISNEICTNENGCVKLKFDWLDKDEESNTILETIEEALLGLGGKNVVRTDQPSAWARVMQINAGSGSISLPRVGQEVSVTFLNGDPDKPIVLGLVHNKSNPFPYSPENANDTFAIRTHTTHMPISTIPSYNELKMRDTPLNQTFAIMASRKFELTAIGDSTTLIGGNEEKIVKNRVLTNIQNDRITCFGPLLQKPSEVAGLAFVGSAFLGATTDITTMQRGVHLVNVSTGIIGFVLEHFGTISFLAMTGSISHTCASMETNVYIKKSETIAGKNTIDVIGDNSLSVTGNNSISIKGRDSKSVLGMHSTSIRGSSTTDVKGAYSVNVTGAVNISGLAMNIEAKTGINMNSTGIVNISGTAININGKTNVTISAPTITLSANMAFSISSSGLVTISGTLITLN
jgi:uncharacterized protein involved in type VI secretion and phage assembly